ncbi:MAG: amidohydrolase [Bacillota bacterium]|nr:amidohydrolase [Bacillota bacterium]
MPVETALKWINCNSGDLIALSDEVWRLAEVGLHELKSAEAQASFLARAGFSIEAGVAHMPAAFVATWGCGSPVVALLGEYDALPGTSQKPVPHAEPFEEGAPGHACGHNLLGVAALGAAIAAKAEMERRLIKGTVKYMGCPAEENAGGKVYMVRDGCFDGVDVALTWHPSSVNSVRLNSSLANHQAKFRFHGRTAHAAGNPEMGRSALDAVELMNVGVNYLREHIIQEARIHYVTTNGGGEPNVVPGVAESWYYIRAPRLNQLKEIYARVVRIAEGASLMTDTKLAVIFPGACANVVPNQPLAEALHRNMLRAGPPEFDPADFEFARQMVGHFPEGQYESSIRRMAQAGIDLTGEYLHRSIAPLSLDRTAMPGSTDVGDVSWITPTAQFGTACFVLGASGHSWQITASSGMSIGHKGMLQAAKVLALTTLEVIEDADLRRRAQSEFEREKGGEAYESMIPPHVIEPPDPFAVSKH